MAQKPDVDFFCWLRAVNKKLFGTSAESILDYPEVPWFEWYRKPMGVNAAIEAFNNLPED